MDAPYVWDHISEGKACIKNLKTCDPLKWPPLTTGMSYSCGQSVSIEKPRDKRRLFLSSSCFKYIKNPSLPRSPRGSPRSWAHRRISELSEGGGVKPKNKISVGSLGPNYKQLLISCNVLIFAGCVRYVIKYVYSTYVFFSLSVVAAAHTAYSTLHAFSPQIALPLTKKLWLLFRRDFSRAKSVEPIFQPRVFSHIQRVNSYFPNQIKYLDYIPTAFV